jgi:hypothetical protein
LMFAGKRHFREFLQSEEGISKICDHSTRWSRTASSRGAMIKLAQKAISLTEMGLACCCDCDESLDPEPIQQRRSGNRLGAQPNLSTLTQLRRNTASRSR